MYLYTSYMYSVQSLIHLKYNIFIHYIFLTKVRVSPAVQLTFIVLVFREAGTYQEVLHHEGGDLRPGGVR